MSGASTCVCGKGRGMQKAVKLWQSRRQWRYGSGVDGGDTVESRERKHTPVNRRTTESHATRSLSPGTGKVSLWDGTQEENWMEGLG